MDKETLSNYGWIVICVLVLAVMIALATPFGQFVADAVKSTTQGLFDVNKNALNAAGVPGLSIADQEFDTPGNRPTIPEGGTYTTGYIVIDPDGFWDVDDSNVVTYTSGDAFPETPSIGDTYTYGNYEYRYNFYFHEFGASWQANASQNGWAVRCINNVADPGPIMESINGEPITSLSFTFDDCTALTDLSDFVIPSNVTSMLGTFSDCTSLTTAPEIPNGVTDMDNTFWGCTSLTTAPEIPSSVKNMGSTFFNCTSLTGTITINTTPSNYFQCLYNTRIREILGDCTIKEQILESKNW